MPLAIALAVSALLHAAAVTLPGWDLPDEPERLPPIETRLLPPVRPISAAAKPKARHSPSPRKPVAPPAAVVEAPAVAEDPNGDAGSAGGLADAAETVPAIPLAAVHETDGSAAEEPMPRQDPPPPPWPGAGRVHYAVTYGEHGFVIGEMIHEWHIDGERYTIRSVAEPRGLAVLRGRKRTQTSTGDVTAGGLRPREFRDEKEGSEPGTATFDWSAARVAFSGNRGHAVLPNGTQDLLSMFYQLAWQAPRQTVDIAVATASRLGRWTFEWVGEENVKLAETDVPALHLRTRADGDNIEVWLAPAYGGLPVKIRYVDRGGSVYEQTANSLGLN